MIRTKSTYIVKQTSKGFLKKDDTFVFDPTVDEPLITLYRDGTNYAAVGAHPTGKPENPFTLDVTLKVDEEELQLRLTEHRDNRIFGLASGPGKNPDQAWGAVKE